MAGVAQSGAEDVRVRLSRKDMAVEAAARALVVATIASGETERGRCLHDQYFGSPLRQRDVLGSVWQAKASSLYEALKAAMEWACVNEPDHSQPLSPQDIELWGRTGNGSVLLELKELSVSGADAAAGMLEAYVQGAHDAVGSCIRAERAVWAVDQSVYVSMGQPIAVAVHDKMRERCGLNADRPEAGTLSLPAMADVEAVARERVLIAQDLWGCSTKNDFSACSQGKYKARARVLWPQLLRKL